ncbi:MAG: flagellar basal body-associated protein FliL [Syntrophobacteraceae bacterium]|nr:flagellar basal body-associated FliL family protein [Desulfobacteraceae bacterium]
MAQETEETKETPQPKSSPLKLIIIIVVALAVLGGGGFFGYQMFIKKDSHAESKPEAPPVIQEMETYLVNLSDPGGKRFLKVTMKLKLSGPQSTAEFTTRTFELRDNILTILSSKEVEDISRPEDKANLKQEIMTQLNRILKQGQVQDVYFTEFLIQ